MNQAKLPLTDEIQLALQLESNDQSSTWASALRQKLQHQSGAIADLCDLLHTAIARVQIANAEGDPILSAWLPDARAALAQVDSRRSMSSKDSQQGQVEG